MFRKGRLEIWISNRHPFPTPYREKQRGGRCRVWLNTRHLPSLWAGAQPPFTLFGTETLKWITIQERKKDYCQVSVCASDCSSLPWPPSCCPLRGADPARLGPARSASHASSRAGLPLPGRDLVQGCCTCVHKPRRTFVMYTGFFQLHVETRTCAHPSPPLRWLGFSSPKEKPTSPPTSVTIRTWLIVRR